MAEEHDESDDSNVSLKMSVEVKDLFGLSKPLQKLVEYICEGIGVAYRPTAIRRDAKASVECSPKPDPGVMKV